MRFKDYIWPYNPRTYQIEYRRQVASHKVPFGLYVLQSLGRTNRVLKGEGEFVGDEAYAEFKKLACVFYENTPGLLIHPVWQNANAYFVSLKLKQEPKRRYVSYSFEFWECYDGYETAAEKIQETVLPQYGTAETQEEYYTVVGGDTLWAIANRYGLSLSQLLEMNTQIKNPNYIYIGDQIRVS